MHLYTEAEKSLEGRKAIHEAEEAKGRKLDREEQFNALEEMLAKDFENYKRTGKILNERPKRNNIFRKIWEWLKKLFGSYPSGGLSMAFNINTVFQKLGKLDFAEFKRDKNNAFFGHLNKAIDGLSIKQTTQLFDALDSFIAEQFRDEGLYIPSLFKDKNAIQNVYHNMLVDFNTNYEHWVEEYNKGVAEYRSADEATKKAMVPELSRISKRVDALQHTVEHWDEIRAQHLGGGSRYLNNRTTICAGRSHK